MDLLDIYDVDRIMLGHTEKQLIELMNKIYGNDFKNKQIVAFEFEYLSDDMN